MTIVLYKTLSEPNSVSKVLGTGLHLTGTLRNGTSVINPEVAIQIGENQSVGDYNYAYIEEFERYYFINDVVLSMNNIWLFSMHVDVLMTYKNKIRSLKAVVSRTEEINKANLYLPDNRLVFEEGSNVSTKVFPNNIPESTEIILVVSGGNTEVAPEAQ